MLLGAARDEGEARQLLLTRQAGDGSDQKTVTLQANGEVGDLPPPQLYLAIESDSPDDAASRAIDTLASAVFELRVSEASSVMEWLAAQGAEGRASTAWRSCGLLLTFAWSSLLRHQDAVAMGSSEISVQKCINRTRDFFVHGVRPLRGLDEVRGKSPVDAIMCLLCSSGAICHAQVDKMLKRKRHLLEKCGDPVHHVLRNGSVSEEVRNSSRE